jgi:ferredoxin-NADP reductase
MGANPTRREAQSTMDQIETPAPPVHYALELREKWLEHGDVWSFAFARRDWFDFQAGQYVHLKLHTDTLEKAVHHMSLASAPGDEAVQFTMHVRPQSPYKQHIAALEPGAGASLFKIKGEFVLPDPLPAGAHVVLLANGIGVTPLRSILRDSAQRGLKLDATLVHVDRGPWLFERELAQLLPTERQLRIARSGLAATLEQLGAAWPEALYFVAGSPGFVFSQQAYLQARGVPEARIRLDNFKAYDDLD